MFQTAAVPLTFRAAFLSLTLLLSSSSAIAQQTGSLSPWVVGAAFGTTADPPAPFADGFYYTAVDGPYDSYGCTPNRFVSFGVVAGRRLTSWLRADLAAAANVEWDRCNATFAGDGRPYAQVQYLGRLPGYAHFTVVARSVLERQDKSGFRPRAVVGFGCICDKRIPLGQLGAGFSAGSLHTRFALEAGAQISHFSWTRRITGAQFPVGDPPLLLEESGTSTPRQFWLRVGLEYTPRVQQ